MRGRPAGSALILTVVLTSLLAIVGVLFVMVSRVDRMASSAVSQDAQLDSAAEAVVEAVSQQLIWDVPGRRSPAGVPAEYHDYPGPEDIWLASTEPNVDPRGGAGYFWGQISDVTGYLHRAGWTTTAVQALVVGDQEPIDLSPAANPDGQLADADGDGVGDSKWFVLEGLATSRGEPIYAAVRVVDNGGKINVNTAFIFDPADPRPAYIDGSRQLQINLMGLAARPGRRARPVDVLALLGARANYGIGIDPNDLAQYEREVTWNYGDLRMPYTPFDISDELELCNRFMLDQRDTHARIEELPWLGSFDTTSTILVPIGSGSSGLTLDDWFAHVNILADPPRYDYRHLATTISVDRVINPDGDKMTSAKTNNIQQLFEALVRGIDWRLLPPGLDANDLAAQLAVNIRDFYDGDTSATVFTDPRGVTSYGIEAQPFISELVFRIDGTDPNNSGNNFFAVELYNPFDVFVSLSGFALELRSGGATVGRVSLPGSIGPNGRVVITNSPSATAAFGVAGASDDPALVLATYTQTSFPPAAVDFSAQRRDLYLVRSVSGTDICLDVQRTQDTWFTWQTFRNTTRSYSRPDNDGNIVYQDVVFNALHTLGADNTPVGTRRNYNLPSFDGRDFTNIGDIARVFTFGPSTDPCDTIGARLAAAAGEPDVRMDLHNAAYTNIFQYLTLMDPQAHVVTPGETRVKGRININTAPSYVLKQLPWMDRGFWPGIAERLAAYRDDPARTYRGFRSIAEVTWATGIPGVPGMDLYATDGVDQNRVPDMTTGDGVADDFEERDLIFSRISDLITVRSDVFTAYILVRLGERGPQRRVVAILDRSLVDRSTSSPRVKVHALHTVPDPW